MKLPRIVLVERRFDYIAGEPRLTYSRVYVFGFLVFEYVAS